MNKLQFRVLYREFLFRMVDLELLSPQAQGDMSKLFGQFASLLIVISILLTVPALGVGGRHRPPNPAAVLSLEHFLIATTMLAVGLFAVLSWDSTFPDKRDVMVLAPLPVHTRTMFFAKIAGIAAAMSLVVAMLHLIAGCIWPLALTSASADGGILSFLLSPALYRTFAAYWIAMLAAGGFVFCCVLAIQGIAAQLLPRRLFLRASSALQLAAFCLFVCEYFLAPMAATPKNLAAAQGHGLAAWQSSFWFLGLFQQLNGSPGLPVLAHRAWIALALVTCITAVAYVLSYFRTLRKIVEEPDILPSARAARWLPRFGNELETVIGQFSVRSLLRSRQHRIILAFYLGMGFALNIFFLQMPATQKEITSSSLAVSAPLLASTIVMMLFSVIGMRIVFAMPLDLRANWIFRITPVRGGANCLAARRRALLTIGVLPIWIGLAALLFSIWPWRVAAAHLVILGLLGAIAAEICLQGFQKIPFTCSYLPGKTNFHMAFLFSILLILKLLDFCAGFEQSALSSPFRYVTLIAVLCGLIFFARWRTVAQTDSDDVGIQFEDEGSPTIQGLGLLR